MLNLLIISNNPKAKLIQSFMQPLIKPKIDVVTDFDHGLKDVFEKRPATVIIQEQIAGVAGESVARHIQLLLGNAAPAFIMIHEGNPRIRPVKGLFEVIVDLDQSDETLVEEVLEALKGVIGDEWGKITVPVSPKSAPVRVVSVKVPDEDRVAADKLVDDFFSDLGTSGHAPQGVVDIAKVQAASTTEELAELLITASQYPEQVKTLDADQALETQPVKPTGGAKRVPKGKSPQAAKTAASSTSAVVAEIDNEHSAAVMTQNEETFDFPALDAAVAPIPVAAVPIEPSPAPRPIVAAPAPYSAVKTAVPPPMPPSPADFRISGTPSAYTEPLSEDILMAFDENYRSRSRLWTLLISAIVVGCVVAGGWSLYNQKPQLLLWRTANTATPAGTPVAAIPVAKRYSSVATAVQKTVTSAARHVSATAASMPTFIADKGRDNEFSARKPGWERYVDATREIRIYRSSGRIKAVQVISAKGQVIADAFMRTVLQEVAGSNEFTERSREQKQGIVVQRCSVGTKSDLLVYRKQPSDSISAFVISVE